MVQLIAEIWFRDIYCNSFPTTLCRIKFFQSHYFHRDRLLHMGKSGGVKDIFTECAKDDDNAIKAQIREGVSDPLANLDSFSDQVSLTFNFGTQFLKLLLLLPSPKLPPKLLAGLLTMSKRCYSNQNIKILICFLTCHLKNHLHSKYCTIDVQNLDVWKPDLFEIWTQIQWTSENRMIGLANLTNFRSVQFVQFILFVWLH